jgi:hypothetical protein
VSSAAATFSRQIASPKPRVEVLGAVLNSLNGAMRGLGYKLESQNQDQVVWRRSWLSAVLRSPWLVVWLPVALFQGTERVTMSLADGTDGGTVITIAGAGPRRLARAFAKLDL